MKSVRFPIALIATFLWIGFVCAISFMEAWLKFRAPGVTLTIGLGIGQLVFSALNKVEIILALAIAGNLLLLPASFFTRRNASYFIPVILLILQSIWLLPALDVRTEWQIKGQPVPSSNLHYYYVIMEAVKVICLSVFGITLFSTIKKHTE